ncbi:ribosome biogenesis GTPase Der [bacterium]|nr:ribosome biogenesis GTPase Der [bacterium]
MRNVAIVGRPNVGKSALFNRLTGRRIAIVDAVSGVTRDRLYAPVEWHGTHFRLIDTGGLAPNPDQLEAHIAKQVELALHEADLILFTVDGQAGRTPQDDAVAGRVRELNKPVWLVVTKTDNERLEAGWADFASYGFSRWFTTSSLHGRGTGALLDAIAEDCAGRHDAADAQAEEATTIAIVGKPNAGKSSLLNTLTGEERAIVSEIAGTTRDAVDVTIKWKVREQDRERDQLVTLIDTAGIRLKKARKTPLDVFSVNRAEKAIARARVVILLVDATAGVSETDKKIAALVAEAGRSCIIGVNKWDLMKGVTDRKAFQQWTREQLPFVTYAPMVFLSAKTGENVAQTITRACEIDVVAGQTVTTGVLNRVLHAAFVEHPPPLDRGRRLKFFYGTQTGVRPPRFLLFVNDPRRAQSTYTSYLVNRLREAFGLEGTPVVLNWRARGTAGRKKG